MRPPAERAAAASLAAEGRNDCEISRALGIPRATVRDWRRARSRQGDDDPGRCPRCRQHHSPEDLPAAAYAYLLGLYLGDGCLSAAQRGVYRLRVVLDDRYPGIIAECASAIGDVLPDRCVGVRARRDSRATEVSAYSRRWACLLPQHGLGRKHCRQIALEPWQRRLTEEQAGPLVRGLIHSDGCRFVNTSRVKGAARTYEYPRYLFSNRSEDIKAILCEHLDLLGIEWRRVGAWEISVARRASVERLDAFVGPKA